MSTSSGTKLDFHSPCSFTLYAPCAASLFKSQGPASTVPVDLHRDTTRGACSLTQAADASVVNKQRNNPRIVSPGRLGRVESTRPL